MWALVRIYDRSHSVVGVCIRSFPILELESQQTHLLLGIHEIQWTSHNSFFLNFIYPFIVLFYDVFGAGFLYVVFSTRLERCK